MQDRFKFRGLGIFSEKWIYGNLIKKEEQTYITNNGIIGYATAVMQTTVKQCTGIKDKNGKLIFEGDIVKVCGTEELGITEIDIKENCIVKWDKKSAFYFCDVINKREIKLTEHGYYEFDYLPLFQNESDEEMFDFEILGNIYENPELLG